MPSTHAPLWRRKLHELFGIDFRSLALFRIAMAVVILGDLFDRSFALAAHYTDTGVLPRRALVLFYPEDARFSLHMASGDLAFQIALFLVAAGLALMLLVGYRTKLATVASWLMLLSLQNRNPLVDQSGDVLFRLLAFWAILLPLGKVWSVDAWRKKNRNGGCRMADGKAEQSAADSSPSAILHPPSAIPSSFLSVATFAVLMQVCFVYWFGYMLKDSPEWREGHALYYALNCDYYVTSFGEWLRGHDRWLTPLTLLVLNTELLGPFVPFIPVWTGPIRTFAVLAMMAMHLVFRLALYIGIFAWVSILGWTLFLPAWFWERRLIKRWTTAMEGFCDRVLTRIFPAPAANNPAAATAPVEPRIANRGKRACAIGGQIVASLFALGALLYILASNLAHQDSDRFGGMVPDPIDDAARLVRLDQHWTMFAPTPPMKDFWVIMVGRTVSKKDVNVWSDAPLSEAKPARIIDGFTTNRWHKYIENMTLDSHRRQRDFFMLYLCHRWNAGRPADDVDRVVAVSLRAMREVTLPDRIADPELETLGAISCPGPTAPDTKETLIPRADHSNHGED